MALRSLCNRVLQITIAVWLHWETSGHRNLGGSHRTQRLRDPGKGSVMSWKFMKTQASWSANAELTKKMTLTSEIKSNMDWTLVKWVIVWILNIPYKSHVKGLSSTYDTVGTLGNGGILKRWDKVAKSLVSGASILSSLCFLITVNQAAWFPPPPTKCSASFLWTEMLNQKNTSLFINWPSQMLC